MYITVNKIYKQKYNCEPLFVQCIQCAISIFQDSLNRIKHLKQKKIAG